MRVLLPLIFLLIIASFVSAQPYVPAGIGGLVTVDNVPVGGLTIVVENLDTGEIQETTTSYDTPYTMCGYYTVALSGQTGHTIKATVLYDGNEYYNTTVIDISLVTNWLNISIDTDNPPDDPPEDDDEEEPPPDDPPDDGNGNGGEPPDDPPYIPPEDDDEEEPEENETELPLYNLTVTVFDDITKDPIDNASVTIYDSNETMITKTYTNESGVASFLLEEGSYIIEAEKGDYDIGRGAINLLQSIEHTMHMAVQNEDASTDPIQQYEQGFPVVPVVIGVCIVVVAVIAVAYFKGWWYV